MAHLMVAMMMGGVSNKRKREDEMLPDNDRFPRGRPGEKKTWKLEHNEHDGAFINYLGKRLRDQHLNLCGGADQDDLNGLDGGLQHEYISYTSPQENLGVLYVTVEYGNTEPEDKVMGFAVVDKNLKYLKGEFWEIDYFCGKGVGEIQMKKVIEDAKNTFGVTGIKLNALSTSVTFYRKLGFKNSRKCTDSSAVETFIKKHGPLKAGTTRNIIVADKQLNDFFTIIAREDNCNDLEECLKKTYRMSLCFESKVAVLPADNSRFPRGLVGEKKTWRLDYSDDEDKNIIRTIGKYLTANSVNLCDDPRPIWFTQTRIFNYDLPLCFLYSPLVYLYITVEYGNNPTDDKIIGFALVARKEDADKLGQFAAPDLGLWKIYQFCGTDAQLQFSNIIDDMRSFVGIRGFYLNSEDMIHMPKNQSLLIELKGEKIKKT